MSHKKYALKNVCKDFMHSEPEGIELLRKAKKGDVVVVYGRLFDLNYWETKDGVICPTIIPVVEKCKGSIVFDIAILYDDKEDKIINHWVLGELFFDDEDIDFIRKPTIKEYEALIPEMIMIHGEIEAANYHPNKQTLWLEYIKNVVAYYRDNGRLSGFSKVCKANGVSKITVEQFYKYGLDKEDKTDAELLQIYEDVKKDYHKRN